MKRRALLPLFSVVLALVLSSCATSGASSRGSANSLTAEEIAEFEALTAYEAIEYARPRWLRPRSLRAGPTPAMGSDTSGPVVYVDGIRAGPIEELRRLRADRVVVMEYMSPSDATTRFGTNHDLGAILVTTR